MTFAEARALKIGAPVVVRASLRKSYRDEVVDYVHRVRRVLGVSPHRPVVAFLTGVVRRSGGVWSRDFGYRAEGVVWCAEVRSSATSAARVVPLEYLDLPLQERGTFSCGRCGMLHVDAHAGWYCRCGPADWARLAAEAAQ